MEVTAPCLVYQRQYCNRHLQWHVVCDPCDPNKAPDVVFDDVTFSPLIDTSNKEELVQLLESWGSSGTAQLAALLQLLLRLYVQHHKEKIAALGDERMLFELAMLEDLGCNEVMLAVAAADGTQQACFSIPVSADLTPAQQLITFTQHKTNSTQNHQQQTQPQEQQSQHEQHFMLHVAFRVGHGVSSHAAPHLQLQMPQWASQYLPALSLPSWDPQTSLVEYVPHLAERLTKHLQDHCPAATLRFELMQSLADALGPPLEVSMHSSAIRNTAMTSSSSSGSLSAATAAKGRGSSSAVFQVLYDQQPLLLFVELTAAFPADVPVLMLQSMRRLGPEGSITLSNVPWSPRWDAEEMAARLFNFVKQEIPNAVAQFAAGSGGSV